MIKLIASDMDGTLLNKKHTICEENLKAIKFAQEKGINFTISTGRDYSLVKPILEEFEIECQCIVMNGAEYRDEKGEVIESIAIKKKNVIKVIEVFNEFELYAEMLTSDGRYVINKEIFECSNLDRREIFCENMTQKEIDEFDKHFDFVFKVKHVDDINEFINSNIEVYKIMTFNKDSKVIEKSKEKLKSESLLSVASTFSNDIEITNVEAQKGLILAKVIEKMGLSREEVMVLGDSFNDYSMFTEFKNSFAMENAIDEIKEIATYITDSNDNSGVAKAIYKMIENS